MFVMRDPHGIRRAFYYIDDEVFVAASERPVIQTVMNVSVDEIKELTPGAAIIVKNSNEISIEQVLPQLDYKHCSFERIYFSRGSDRDIYTERKTLGHKLVPQILKAVNGDIDNTIVSFIPNTAEVAYMGMVEGLEAHLSQLKLQEIKALDPNSANYDAQLERILARRIRTEKIAIKDIKLRTFITEGNQRNDLAAHVYDVTYGQVRDGVDNLVVIDDSIVRGTTLRQSIIRILARLKPKKIVVVSSSPQVRYPDFYGIDMSRLSDFIAFRAAVALLEERGMQDIMDRARKEALAQRHLPKEQMRNVVEQIYAPFTEEEISRKIAELLTPPEVDIPVEIVYQSLEGLHTACPRHTGDWYFSGHYPTPGGVRMLNETFLQ